MNHDDRKVIYELSGYLLDLSIIFYV